MKYIVTNLKTKRCFLANSAMEVTSFLWGKDVTKYAVSKRVPGKIDPNLEKLEKLINNFGR